MCRHQKKTVDDATKEIVWAKIIYGRLWKIRNQLNRAFGLSLLAVCVQRLAELVIYPYWIFFVLWQEIGQQQELVDAYALMLTCFVLMVTLFSACDNCTQEGERVDLGVRQILLKTNDLNTIGGNFVLQTIHQPFSITANGFFTINLNTVVMVIYDENCGECM